MPVLVANRIYSPAGVEAMLRLTVVLGVINLTGVVLPRRTLGGRGTAEVPTTFQSVPSESMTCKPLRPYAITDGKESAVVPLKVTGG